MTGDDDFLIAEDDDVGLEGRAPAPPRPWRILIVDDDHEVHAVTRLSLRRFVFEERPVELISAYSAAEAIEILSMDLG